MYLKYITLLVFLSISFIIADELARKACSLEITQTARKTWTNDDGSVYTLYDCFLSNVGDLNATDAELKASTKFIDFWGLDEDGDSFYFPYYVLSIAVGENSPFTYVTEESTPADFTISDVICPEETKESRDTQRHRHNHNKHGNNSPTRRPSSPSSPTRRPSSTPTPSPTRRPTTAPTAAPTPAATQRPTSAPTQRPTTAPTSAPTQRPTTAPTSAPDQRPTAAPTSAPTTAPTSAPTQRPTTAPSAGGRICPAGTWWAPSPMTTWQWQLTGTIDTSVNVQMIDIDLFDNSASTIQTLHNKGIAVICYFSTQYENWRPDASSFTSAVLGNNLDDWPGERYVDIRSTVVRNIMTARMDLAVQKGCDGVEPDNVDGYQANNGFSLTSSDQQNFNTFLANQAHQRFLSIALKNDLSQVNTLQPYFDFAINEQCNQYSECSSLNAFVNAGKAVFNCEYSGTPSTFCPRMNTAKISSIKKNLNLDASIAAQCCSYATGGCGAQAAHSCVTAVVSQVRDSQPLVEEPSKPTQQLIENGGFSLNTNIFFTVVTITIALILTAF